MAIEKQGYIKTGQIQVEKGKVYEAVLPKEKEQAPRLGVTFLKLKNSAVREQKSDRQERHGIASL
jgi:hypothetical protein